MKITEDFADTLSPSGAVVSIKDLLLQELDDEIKKTRATLERVPADKKDFAPHSKSTPLGRLAPHVAQQLALSTVEQRTGADRN